MAKFTVALALALCLLPAFSAKLVTVGQLEQVLADGRGNPDAKIAQQISDIQLVERLSKAGLLRLETETPGPESRKALELISDLSAFHDLPAAEIPLTPAPATVTQRQILAHTVEAVWLC